MTRCICHLDFALLSRKAVAGGFDGGDISSNGGLMLIAELDRRLGVTARMAASLGDSRQAGKVRHSVHDLPRQRIYQIAAGYEDGNEGDTLRGDPVLKVAAGRLPESGADLATQPALSRFENSPRPSQLYRLAGVFLDLFVVRHAARPRQQVLLDLDATDDEPTASSSFSAFTATTISTAICRW